MKRIVLTLLACMVASTAQAHTGANHSASFFTGLSHPVGGIDHIAAMVTVGAWSAVAGGAARLWSWPLAFVLAMLAGAIAGAAGFAVPLVEPMIAASVIVAGLLVAIAVPVPVAIGAAVVAAFAVLHGHAHGTEAPAGSFALYFAGFATATAALHAAGIAFALVVGRIAGTFPIRAAGVLVAATGVALLIK